MEPEQLNKFIEKYVSMWHESDPIRRHQIVAELWTEDGEDFTSTLTARGIDEISERVSRAYDEWVAQKGFIFQPSGNTDSHHHVIKFFWKIGRTISTPFATPIFKWEALSQDWKLKGFLSRP